MTTTATKDERNNWVIIGQGSCRFCTEAVKMFQAKGIDYSYISITNPDTYLKDFLRLSGLKTVPQIFLNGYLIGGFEETKEYLENQYAPYAAA